MARLPYSQLAVAISHSIMHRGVALREEATNNHSDPSSLSQLESMLYLDWVLMKDWALMQANTRDKDWVPMKEKGE